jgi:ligand-binding sensor domain-containing protein
VRRRRIEPIDLHAMHDAQDVFDFHEDGDGTMWMATDRGLVRYRNGRMASLGLGRACRSITLFQVVDDLAAACG